MMVDDDDSDESEVQYVLFARWVVIVGCSTRANIDGTA